MPWHALQHVVVFTMNFDMWNHGGGGGGVTSIIKVYTDVRLEWGILFRPPSIWMGIIFTSEVYQWGIFFTKKVYEWVKFWKIVYEWGQFSKIVYEWGQFSIWEVYEWVMFFTWPGIWMGWGSGTPAAHPYPKSWQVTPPPPCVKYERRLKKATVNVNGRSNFKKLWYNVKDLVTRNAHVGKGGLQTIRWQNHDYADYTLTKSWL